MRPPSAGAGTCTWSVSGSSLLLAALSIPLLLLGPVAVLAAVDGTACNGRFQAPWEQQGEEQQAASQTCGPMQHSQQYPPVMQPADPPTCSTPFVSTPPCFTHHSLAPSLTFTYFGLWLMWIQRLKVMDGQLPDGFLIIAATSPQPQPKHRHRRRPPNTLRCTAYDKGSGTPMCPWNSTAACRERPRRAGLVRSPAFPAPREGERQLVTVTVPVQSWRAARRLRFRARDVLELLQRWLRGGSWVYGKGSTRISVPSLQRWGLSSLVAGVLVRVELLWLLDKAYVAVTLLFLLPLLVGGGLLGAAALLDRLVRRSERCENRRRHSAWQQQIAQQQRQQQGQGQQQQQHPYSQTHLQGVGIES